MFISKTIIKFQLFFALALTGCAGLTPKNQNNNFAPPASLSEEARKDLEKKVDEQNSQIRSTQSNYQAVQNGLIDLNGEVVGIKASMDKIVGEINGIKEANFTGINEMNNNLSSRIDLLSSATFNIKNELKSQLDAEIKASVNSALNQQIQEIKAGRDSFFTQNSIWTYVVLGVVTLLLVGIFGVVIIFIFDKIMESKVEARISSMKSEVDLLKASAVVLPSAYKISTDSEKI